MLRSSIGLCLDFGDPTPEYDWYIFSTWDGLDAPVCSPPSSIILPPREGGPLPKELLGLMPKVPLRAPELDPPKSCWVIEFPPDEESCRSAPFSVSEPRPPPNEEDCSAESSGPPTLKNPVPSPMLSKDWLNSEKEGAISSEFVG